MLPEARLLIGTDRPRLVRHDACNGFGVWQRAPVLIVSGHPGAQDAYVRFLRDLRLPVVGVDTVDEATLLLQHFPVRAALFDVLAYEDWDSCRRLRERLPSSIPVIVLSGAASTDGESHRLATRIGCAGLLAKPCAPETLVTTIERATAGESQTVAGNSRAVASATRLRAQRSGG